MEAIGVLQDLFGRAREGIALIAGLSDDELHGEPSPSTAWLAWRMGRSLDANVSGLVGQEQLWLADGWHERFGMPPDLRDFLPGFPQPNESVQTFRAPSAQLLIDYYEAAHQRTSAYLATLGGGDLDRVLDEPQYDPRPTVSVRLVSVAVSVTQSAGTFRYRLWMAGKGR